MTKNSALQVFKGGWEELENAVHTINDNMLPASSDGHFIKPDGTKLFAINISSESIETYPLAIPWDVATRGAKEDEYFSITPSNLRGFFIKSDGTKLYILDSDNKLFYELDIPTPWVLSSIIFTTKTIDLSDIAQSPSTCILSRDGDHIYFPDGTSVYDYPLPTPWDISSNVTNSSFTPASFSPISIALKPEGNLVYLGELNGSNISEYSLSTPNDITTATPTGNTFDTGIFVFTISIQSNGLELFVLHSSGQITKHHLDEAWNISTGTYFSNSNETPGFPFAVFWKPDGMKYFTLDSGENITEWNVVSPWNVTNATQGSTFDATFLESNIQGMWWKPDGTRLYLIGTITDTVFQLNAGTPWEVSTITDPSVSVLLTGLISPAGLTMRADGMKLWVCDQSPDDILEYNMATPWDITTAVAGVTKALPGVNNLSHAIFRTDGKILYISDRTNASILIFRLTTPWDVTTIGAVIGSFDTSNEQTNPRGMAMRESDGKKLFITGFTPRDVTSYDISLEFNNAIITNFGEELETNSGETLVYA